MSDHPKINLRALLESNPHDRADRTPLGHSSQGTGFTDGGAQPPRRPLVSTSDLLGRENSSTFITPYSPENPATKGWDQGPLSIAFLRGGVVAGFPFGQFCE